MILVAKLFQCLSYMFTAIKKYDYSAMHFFFSYKHRFVRSIVRQYLAVRKEDI